jgi:hypothetical protein
MAAVIHVVRMLLFDRRLDRGARVAVSAPAEPT